MASCCAEGSVPLVGPQKEMAWLPSQVPRAGWLTLELYARLAVLLFSSVQATVHSTPTEWLQE